MKTIHSNSSNEIIIKNSRFICYLISLESDSIQSYLDEIKKEHPKATHYCYAYVFDSIFHFQDDGEPGGTAGMPILNVLQKEELNHVLCVVVRYFGGIKLGAGGLVRAYTKAVTETLKISSFDEMVPGYKIDLDFPYEEENNVLYILGNLSISSREYFETVHYTCMVGKDVFDKLAKYHPNKLEDCYIKNSNVC